MTVICTLISKDCTVHVTDSNLSAEIFPNSYQVIEDKRSKILPLQHFDGALSYFGFAKDGDFDFYECLKLETDNLEMKYSKDEAEKFVKELTQTINKQFEDKNLQGSVGLGIHLTVYEKVGDDQIPELFYIHNWTGGYLNVAPEVIWQRHSYFTSTGEKGSPSEDHRDEPYRRSVQTFLQKYVLYYNNGNPGLFNPFAGAYFNVVGKLDNMGYLDKNGVELLADLALLPVKSVCDSMKRLAGKDKQIIGGKIHRVIIEPGKKSRVEELN